MDARVMDRSIVQAARFVGDLVALAQHFGLSERDLSAPWSQGIWIIASTSADGLLTFVVVGQGFTTWTWTGPTGRQRPRYFDGFQGRLF